MFFKQLKDEWFNTIFLKDNNGLLFFFFTNVLVFIFNIDDFFILEQHQKVFVLFIYIHLNAIIFFNICLFLMCILIYLYFFNKKHFSFLDYTIITNLFFYYGFLICISGFFWGLGVWGAKWFEDPRIISLIVFLFFLYFFNKVFIYFYSNVFNKKKLVLLFLLLIFILINFFIILKFSTEWWDSLHQTESIDFFNSLIFHKLYINIVHFFLILFFLSLIIIRYIIRSFFAKQFYNRYKKFDDNNINKNIN